jgi:hypothetical protein
MAREAGTVNFVEIEDALLVSDGEVPTIEVCGGRHEGAAVRSVLERDDKPDRRMDLRPEPASQVAVGVTSRLITRAIAGARTEAATTTTTS